MADKKREYCLYSRREYYQMRALHRLGFTRAEIMEKTGLNMSQVTRFLKQYEIDLGRSIYEPRREIELAEAREAYKRRKLSASSGVHSVDSDGGDRS